MTRTANIPNVLFPENTAAPKTVEAAYGDEPPISPFSGKRMLSAMVGQTPVFVDQQMRVVVPQRKY